MNNRNYFIIGCKLLGVYFLFMSLPYLVQAITVLSPHFSDKYPKYFRDMIVITKMATCIIPVVFILSGLYLIRNGKLLHDYAYPNSVQTLSSSVNDKMIVALRLLGIYLIVSEFPNLLKSISSYIVYLNTPTFMNMAYDQIFTYVNFFPSLGGILMGIYLLKKDNYIVKYATIHSESDVSDERNE